MVRRRKVAPRPKSRTKCDKRQRNRYHDQGQTAKERASPLDTEIVEQLSCEQGECGAHRRSKDCVCGEYGCGTSCKMSARVQRNGRGYSAGGDLQFEIAVDEVVEAL